MERDRDRLRDSSDIEGVTRTELEAHPEVYLTADRLKAITLTELVALDSLRVPFELLKPYVDRFIECKEFDHAADALEKIGYSEELDSIWHSLIFTAAFFERNDLSLRLIKLRSAAGFPAELEPMYHLLTVEGDPAKSWEWVDNEALQVLESDYTDELRNFALALLLTKHQELGILLCRGVIPLLSSPAEASSMLDYVMAVRDQLYLHPEEPISEVVDKLWTANDEALETDNELRETKELFELKRREASEAKQSLERLQRELKRREQALAQLSAAKAAEPEDGEVSRELRQKIQKVEQQLKERNAERNSLRHELQKKQLEIDVFRDRAEKAAREPERDSETGVEDDLLLPQESEIHQPLRLIEFLRNFEQRLHAVPRNVARAALAALGRLAGREPAAFVGAVRLKACPSVTRQRIGIDHRLLFRLLPDRIQVIDLIPRSDLERKVKILATQYD